MKILIAVLFLSATSFASTESSVEKTQEKRDLNLICAVAKTARTLSNDPHFKEKADRISTVWAMIHGGIKSEEVRNVVKAISVADPSQKVKLLRQAARDAGLKKWNCANLDYLF